MIVVEREKSWTPLDVESYCGFCKGSVAFALDGFSFSENTVINRGYWIHESDSTPICETEE